ncbi:32721_t:CDS:1, partial [Racocetra persica]
SNEINVEEYLKEACHSDIDIEELVTNVEMVTLKKGYSFPSFDDAKQHVQ